MIGLPQTLLSTPGHDDAQTITVTLCLDVSPCPAARLWRRTGPPLPSTPFVAPALRAQHQPLSANQGRELQQWVQDKAASDHQQKRWQNGPAHNNYGKIIQRKSTGASGVARPARRLGGRDPERRARPDDRRACAMLRQF